MTNRVPSFRSFALACSGAALLTAALAVPALAQISVPSETIPGHFDADKAVADRQTLAADLLAAEGKARIEGLTVMPGVEVLERLATADPNAGRLLVGESLPLESQVRFDAAANKMLIAEARPIANGMLHKRADGFVWFTKVRSEGAKAVRLHFTDFNLPRGAEMYVYTEKEAYGPYIGKGLYGDGEFWSHIVFGSEVRVQVRYTGDLTDRVMAGSMFEIADVIHLGDRFFLADWMDSAQNDKAFCSFNASCVQNRTCSSIPSAIQPAITAVAHLQFNVGSGAFICSGGLLNDTDGSTTKPYLLTANHCFSSSASASSLTSFFQFSTSCGGSCGSASGNQVNGSTLRATNATSDFTLVELSGSLPGGSTLLGWTTSAVANSNNTSLYRISHPGGAPQAYSRHSVDTSAGTCSGIPRGAWIYSRDTFGATEGGSSGSVVLNSSGQVVGQLTGACGTNTGNPCDSNNNATIDGALASYFSQVEQYLDPQTGGCTHSGSPGSANYCSTSCPCDDGFGDCDNDNECVSGTTCVSNVGPNYGWASWVDVCEGSGGGGGPNSCVGNCGGQASGGCWCDSQCASFGDCCSDKVSVCG